MKFVLSYSFNNTNLDDCNAVWYNVEEVRLLLMMAPFVGGVSPLFGRIPWGGAVISVKPSPNICCSSSHFCGTENIWIADYHTSFYKWLIISNELIIILCYKTNMDLYFNGTN